MLYEVITYKTKMMPKKEINEKMGPILKPYYNSLNKLHANAIV